MRWLVAFAAALLLGVQVVAVTQAWQRYRPRLPGLAAVEPLLDKGIGDVLSAVGDRAAVAVSGVVGYTACQRTFLAKGSRFNRIADLYTDPGTEGGLIAAVAARMPAADRVARGAALGGDVAPLTADLGSGVEVRLSRLGEGWLEAVAETDCRSGTPAPSRVPATVPETLTHVLTDLGTTLGSAHTDTVACAGHPVTTVSAISGTARTDDLPARLAARVPAGAHRFGSSANRLAWRDTTGSTIVAASDDGTHVTVQLTDAC